MKPALLIAAAVAAIIGVAAIAFATTGGSDDNDDTARASPTPASTATAKPTNTTAASPTAAPSATTVPSTATSTTEPATATPAPPEPSATVPPAPTPSSLPAGRHPEPAPIDELDVRIAESFPPQYFVYILAGLPSGCVEQYTHTVARSGNDVIIEVLNSAPDGTPFCTAIYGQYELNLPLGSDFVSGQDYTVIVNGGDAEFVFTAQ